MNLRSSNQQLSVDVVAINKNSMLTSKSKDSFAKPRRLDCNAL